LYRLYNENCGVEKKAEIVRLQKILSDA
jgi:hypothetical protein